MLPVYCISGLAANESVFERVEFPKGYEKICIPWIEAKKNEGLEDYAIRLTSEIRTEEEFMLMGFSFGGIISTVLTPILKPKLCILISSIAGGNELPWYFRASGRMKLNALLHMKSALKAAPFALDLMGANTPTDKEFLKDMIKQASENLLYWSIDKILNWDNRVRPDGIVQIHGTKDKVLPHIYTKADYLIEGGNHFMIRNKSEEVNKVLRSIFNDV